MPMTVDAIIEQPRQRRQVEAHFNARGRQRAAALERAQMFKRSCRPAGKHSQSDSTRSQ